MPRSRRSVEERGGGGHGSIEADIHRKLAQLGLSQPGRDWLMRALHPASEKRSPGLPDESSSFVLRPDFRIVDTISGPIGGGGQWDCYMWMPPGDCNALYWATAPSPADFSTHKPPDFAQTGVIKLQETNTTSDPTRPYQVQFGVAASYYLTNVPSLRASSFRHQFKSVTIEQIASAVSDQGQVYAAQFPPALRTSGMVVPVGYDSGVPVTPPTDPPTFYGLIAEQYTTILPVDERALSRMNPDFYQAPSREGAYMPLRLSGPSQPFVRSVTSDDVHQIDGAAGFLATSAAEAPVGALLTPNTGALQASRLPSTDSLIPWVFQVSTNVMHTDPGGQPVVVPGLLACDTGYDNINMGVVIFRGLQGGQNGSFGSALQVKVIAGIEMTPLPGQGDGVFSEPPAPYEPRAMEAYYRLCLELKGVYPARFNSFDDILDAIGSAAKKIWNNVEPTVVAGLSGLAKQGMGMLTSGLGGMMLTGARRGGPPRVELRGPRVTYRAPSVARSASTAVSTRLAKTRSTKRGKVR